jgi:hypothetical protein
MPATKHSIHHHHATPLFCRGRPRPAWLPIQVGGPITACAAFTADMLAMENDYNSCGLIAITVCDNPWVHLTRDAVQEAARSWLEIPYHNVGVKF